MCVNTAARVYGDAPGPEEFSDHGLRRRGCSGVVFLVAIVPPASYFLPVAAGGGALSCFSAFSSIFTSALFQTSPRNASSAFARRSVASCVRSVSRRSSSFGSYGGSRGASR